MAKCPGQDMYFWTPEDIFESPCPACGEGVEFFKTDPARKCDTCGYTFPNPRLDLGCAEWCPQAEMCLGVKLSTQAAEAGGEEGTVRLVDKLIMATRDALGHDRKRMIHALSVLRHAQDLLREECGEPRVILPVAVFSGVDGAGNGEAAPSYDPAAIMDSVGFPEEVVAGAVSALTELRTDHIESPEAAVVWDANQLSRLSDSPPGALDGADVDRIVANDFRTVPGKSRARTLLQS